MATAPFSMYVDTAAVSKIVKAGTAVTVTTNGSHNLVTGAYAQVELIASSTLGTAVAGVYQVTVTSGSVFTYAAAGTAAGTVGSDETSTAIVALDLLNPPINYAAASRQQAVYVDISSLNLSASGDGSSDTMSFTAMQDVTPTLGPWWTLIPDDARVRLVKADTGTTPSSTFTDVYFQGIVSNVSARMNGSGQGNIADVSLDDANVILDRLAIAGQVAASSPGQVGSISRSSGTATITLDERQKTTWYAGLAITLSGFIGGNGTSWNGNFTVASVGTVSNPTYGEPPLQVIKYLQAGSDNSYANQQAITSVARSGKSTNQIKITFSGGHGLTQPVGLIITGVIQTTGDGSLAELINQRYSSSAVSITNSTTLTLTLSRAVTNWHTLGGGVAAGLDSIVVPTDQQDGAVVGVPPGKTESQVVQLILAKVNSAKAGDRFLQKLFDTSVTTGISGTSNTNALPIALPAGSLRSMLDATVEAFQGQDSRVRRYHLSLDRKLNYTLVDSVAKPTYATAPYSITTSSAGTPNTTTSKATVAPFNLSVSYQHSTTKGAVFNTTSSGPTTVSYLTYTQAGYTARKGPIFDETVEFASPAATSPSAVTRRFATSFFLERSTPLLVGSFELRGAGTLAGVNDYGFSAGYAQTGASTFALVSRWKPGQWVEVVSVPLSINGYFTVEAVDWSLEPGSYTQVIRVTFNRKNPATLTALLAKSKG